MALCGEDHKPIYDYESASDLDKIERMDHRSLAELFDAIERFDPINEPLRSSVMSTPQNADDQDSAKKIRQRQPDNVDVRDLCKLLEKNRAHLKAGTKSEIGVAREHTGEPIGNCPDADNLLRQARRYPDLWK